MAPRSYGGRQGRSGSTGERSAVISILITVVLIFLAAMLFQWIYGLDLGEANTEPTSYIFLIDDSGSMAENDPTKERYRTIHRVNIWAPVRM